MDNPRFVDDENIPLAEEKDIDYDDYNTANTSRLDETSFAMPSFTEKETTLRLRQKEKQDQYIALCRHINIAGNPDLISLNRFLGTAETPPALEKSFKAANKLMRKFTTDMEMACIPLDELSSLVEYIHVKTREASQNTDFEMQEFLGIDKALQSIQGELLNNTSKLTGINKRIKRDTKKLGEKEDDPIYSDEKRQL